MPAKAPVVNPARVLAAAREKWPDAIMVSLTHMLPMRWLRVPQWVLSVSSPAHPCGNVAEADTLDELLAKIEAAE